MRSEGENGLRAPVFHPAVEERFRPGARYQFGQFAVARLDSFKECIEEPLLVVNSARGMTSAILSTWGPEPLAASLQPFLLSGILYCTCGAAMVGDRDKGKPFYICGRQKREWRDSCDQSAIVAWYLHKFVCDWLVTNVLTFDRLKETRNEINHRLSGDRGKPAARKIELEKQRNGLDRESKRLVDAIAKIAVTTELERG